MPKVGVISLGCAKNLVDSETMIGLLKAADFSITNKAEEADVLIVNTCAFINKAKEESIETILEMAEFKKNGVCKVLVVTGCLSERYRDKLMKEIPEIDALVGTGDFEEIVEVVNNSLQGKKTKIYGHQNKVFSENLPRIISNSGKYAYVKIADGCNNRCTYCVIPSLRGRYRSRDIADINREVKAIVENGVKEIILIAQDTTRYGIDKGRFMLSDLLYNLSEIDGLKWIRILYCYPEAISDQLIDAIATNDKVCKYIDMPIQHISDEILRKMGRHTSKKEIYNLIDKLRTKIPGVVLRTSLIVGFPGETQEQFNELVSFVEESKFDHLGVFEYSREEGTPAAKLPGQIPERVKKERRDVIMKLQNNIARQLNQQKVGKIFDVLIEGKKGSYYIGRTYHYAPEIDGIVYIKSDKFISGDFARVLIKKAYDYDILGEIVE
ncbi:30S ribosomal protein S12 methylthiotransferase RimO [Caldanaerobius fijiensis]|uniref:30S ribosomal protein S12 methylthiotransferase RimO n=1 Tax=Caldanaerobius fijiensis TaxID=456330 RepID=UPI0009322284|nr:30S ribosomal protein S12 methylthiotransferase RimO [Caldanaerobius fijiensis]